MKTKEEIEKAWAKLDAIATDGENPEHKELLAQLELVEWILDIGTGKNTFKC